MDEERFEPEGVYQDYLPRENRQAYDVSSLTVKEAKMDRQKRLTTEIKSQPEYRDEFMHGVRDITAEGQMQGGGVDQKQLDSRLQQEMFYKKVGVYGWPYASKKPSLQSTYLDPQGRYRYKYHSSSSNRMYLKVEKIGRGMDESFDIKDGSHIVLGQSIRVRVVKFERLGPYKGMLQCHRNSLLERYENGL